MYFTVQPSVIQQKSLQWAVGLVLSDAVACDWRISEGRAIWFCYVYGFGLIETQNYVISRDFLGWSPPHCGKILYLTNKKTSHLSPPPPPPPRLWVLPFSSFRSHCCRHTHYSMDSLGRRKIRLVNEKCGYLKTFTKGLCYRGRSVWGPLSSFLHCLQ